MPLCLHAITATDAHHAPEQLDGATVIIVRDLAAVVSEQTAFVAQDPAPAERDAHRAIVDALFRRGPVLPAPAGVLFRAPDILTRWMELHYVALSDALEFVEDRAVARVHMERVDGKPDEREAGVDLAAAAAEVYRALRRRAVAALPLTTERVTGIVLSASFLVDRELWTEFMSAVEEEHESHQDLRLDVTGPWAPYDFVRMEFGA
jgi:hypothetical protein